MKEEDKVTIIILLLILAVFVLVFLIAREYRLYLMSQPKTQITAFKRDQYGNIVEIIEKKL